MYGSKRLGMRPLSMGVAHVRCTQQAGTAAPAADRSCEQTEALAMLRSICAGRAAHHVTLPCAFAARSSTGAIRLGRFRAASSYGAVFMTAASAMR